MAAPIPEGVEVVTPGDEQELARVLGEASAQGRRVAVWGGGTHRGVGTSAPPDLVISTASLAGVLDWQPEDLTVVVGAGVGVADLEQTLAAGGQSAVLAERPGAGTVGGAVATATSGYRRLRHGPIRDRVLEVRAVTGDGRVVKGGGRVVKNVTGYDLPRLYCGSLGCMGVITSVCFKLWPLTEAAATVVVEEVAQSRLVHRPLAVLETPGQVTVLLAGTAAEVDSQVERLAGERIDGLVYPEVPAGHSVWSVRVRPRHLVEAVARLPSGSPYVAQHGVGEVTVALDRGFDLAGLRSWVEAAGGAVVRLSGAPDQDPWGTPPPGVSLQRRLVQAFDPAGILESGRLPGAA